MDLIQNQNQAQMNALRPLSKGIVFCPFIDGLDFPPT